MAVETGVDQRLPPRRLGVEFHDGPTGALDRADDRETVLGQCAKEDMGCGVVADFSTRRSGRPEHAVVELIEHDLDGGLAGDLGLKGSHRYRR